ncbi:Zinc finger, PHD-finger [Phytophthora cactorum]|nr:Zinc finger, PHD-finger [Phytophthora cactorum]
MEPPPGYQERPSDGPVVYQGRLIQGSAPYQGRVVDGSAGGKLYQGRMTEASSSGKMAEDYKRERKLPPRVEEMLREQVNLDESVLHDAYAVAMEDLIPEEEANFVAKGLCHLCGVSEGHYVPVVNFCPMGRAPLPERICAQSPPTTLLNLHARMSVYKVHGGEGAGGAEVQTYPPTPPAEARPPIQRDGLPARSIEAEKAFDGRRQLQFKPSESDKYPTDAQNAQDGYAPSMQAQPKSPSQYPPVPKRAAKDTSAGMLAVMAESAPTDPRVAARSEKSLVQLLSSLNQGGTPASSAAMDASSQSSKDSSYRPSDNSNGIAARSESSGNTQSSGDAEMEASPQTYSGRGIADRRRQEESPYQDQSSTSSNESDSPRRPRVGARPIGETPPRKRKASESNAEDSPAPRDSEDMSSRDDSKVPSRGDSAAKEQSNHTTGKPQHKAEASSKLSAKLSEKNSTLKADKKANHSAPTPTPTPPPIVDRGVLAIAPPAKKTTQKPAPPVKRGRGRPPKRAKQVKQDDEETEDETYQDDSGSDSELDANLDFCEVCQGAGDLVCCDKCPRSYHLKCLHMTENDLPEGDWQEELAGQVSEIVACLKSHPFSKPFLTPVENVPMYTRVVKQPMDLSKIENKLKKGAYVVGSNVMASGVKELDVTHFANDIRLIVEGDDGEMQIVTENVKPTDASFIKFKILSGWDDFVVVHRVSVEGSTSRR